MTMIQTFARDATHCELCGIPNYLYPFAGDRTICADCGGKLKSKKQLHLPCVRCGRTYSNQFLCGICYDPVCDVCVRLEHENDDCDEDYK